jgi:hypothetical protein
MKKGFWIKKVLCVILLVIAAATLLSYIVMSLWNAVLVPVLNVSTVTFWQAAGILVLSKILFGGFKGKGGGRGPWKKDLREKWQNMNPEEREQMKQQWRDRCSRWGRKDAAENADV